MDKPYPIVAERVLVPVAPKRLLSLRPHSRSSEELPKPRACQKLVYGVNGGYVLDDSNLRPDSPTVVEASHVSVVDVTTDTEVAVTLTIPSKDATSFTIRVTFLCAVHDPVAVVRSGGHDASAMLTAYLRGHHRIFELGLDFTLADINEVRRKLSAQVRAYVTVMPPEFTGMIAELASVEVLTPEEIAEFQASLREERQRFTVDLERDRNEQVRIEQQQHYERQRDADGKRHTWALTAEQRNFERSEQQMTAETVADDPNAALALSYAAGEITAKELADELKRVRELEMAQDRDDLRTRIEFDREQQRAMWSAEREDRVRNEVWEREDRNKERELRQREMEAKLQVIHELTKHGHLDSANIHLERIINEMLSVNAGTSIAGGTDDGPPKLEQRPAGEEAELIDDEKIRVEDAH